MRRKLLICAVLVVLVMALAGYFTKGILSPKIGICLSSEDSELEKSLRDELVLAGYTVLSRNGENDQEKQNQQVRALLQKDVTVLVVQPVNAAAVTEILHMAVETPVIFIGQEPAELGNAYYVGCDAKEQGAVQAGLLESLFDIADINNDKCVDYMTLSGPAEDGRAQLYLQNVAAAMAEYSTQKLEEALCDCTSAAAKTLCRQAFSKYGRDLELILCSSDALALGAIDAVISSGRTPGEDVIIFSIGTEESCLETVGSGALTAAVVEDTATIRSRLVQVVNDLAKGKTVSQKNYVSYKILITDKVS